MDGSTAPTKNAPRRTPAEHWDWQAVDNQGAQLGLEILDEVRAGNLINRGQKHLHQVLGLKNLKLFGKDAVDAVTIPEDDTRINCPEVHHHYADKKPAAAASGGMSLAKIALGAVLAGTGVGAGVGIPLALSGLFDSPPAVTPADPKSDAPVVNIGGQEYELRLEPDTEE